MCLRRTKSDKSHRDSVAVLYPSSTKCRFAQIFSSRVVLADDFALGFVTVFEELACNCGSG